MFDRATLQMLATKLDAKAVTLSDAKKFVKTNYGLEIKGITRDQFIRNAAKHIA